MRELGAKNMLICPSLATICIVFFFFFWWFPYRGRKRKKKKEKAKACIIATLRFVRSFSWVCCNWVIY
jgi:hypothetical protein